MCAYLYSTYISLSTYMANLHTQLSCKLLFIWRRGDLRIMEMFHHAI